jgi:hypothetical protein
MVTHFRASKGYTKNEIQGYVDPATGEAVAGLEGLCWNYIQSNSLPALEANRQILLDQLEDSDKAYILDIWLPKEGRSVQVHTKYNTNFGYFSTQRIESLNRTMHKIVHHQISLEQAALEIVTWSKNFYRDYEEDLHKSRTERSIAIDQNYFSSLSGSVTLKAIELVNEQ